MTAPRIRVSRLERALLVLVLGAFLYFPDRTLGTNGVAHFAQTYTIVQERSLAIDAFAQPLRETSPGSFTIDPEVPRKTIDWSYHRGHYYPGKAPGLSLLAVPVYAVLALVDRATGTPPLDHLETDAYLTNLVVNVLLAAVASVLVLRACVALGAPPGPAAAATAALALGTAYFPYATALFYAHTPSAALVGLAGYAALGRPAGAPPDRRAFASGLLVGLAVLTEYACATAVVVFLVYWAYAGGVRSVLGYLLGGLGPLAVFAWYHAVCFGSPTTLAYACLNPMFSNSGGFAIRHPPRVWVLLELVALPYRGLAFYSPVLLLGLAGLGPAWRSPRRAELLVGPAFALTILLANASLPDWWGGWSTGPRYATPALPLLAPVVALGLARAPRLVGAALAAVSLANYLTVSAVGYDCPERFRSPLGRAYGLLAAGELGRTNLGRLVGLPGAASLLPFVAFAVVAGLALLRAALSEGASPASRTES